jgi:rhodanese-related sulfurtransferase
VKFIIDNALLIAIAFASGAMLIWPLVARRSAGPILNTLGATRLINDGATVLDIRDGSEFAGGHLPNAKNIPLADLDKRAAELPADKPILVMCGVGQRSLKAASTLRKAGKNQVFSLEGGLKAWRDAGLPVVKA